MEAIEVDGIRYVDYCSICGFALTLEQVAASLEGQIIDFSTKDKGVFNIVICNECRENFFENTNTTLQEAVDKSERLRKGDTLWNLEGI